MLVSFGPSGQMSGRHFNLGTTAVVRNKILQLHNWNREARYGIPAFCKPWLVVSNLLLQNCGHWTAMSVCTDSHEHARPPSGQSRHPHIPMFRSKLWLTHQLRRIPVLLPQVEVRREHKQVTRAEFLLRS